MNTKKNSVEPLTEVIDLPSPASKVDSASGLIRDVKILGLTSRNRRRYQEAALRAATALYDGAKVYVNHARGGPNSPRDYQERLGAIRNARYKSGDGLFGDLHFNPNHPVAEQLAWDAQHAPENVGLSHSVEAVTRRERGELVVEEILSVQSVDLVADPATTSGLFECSTATDNAPPQEIWTLTETEIDERYDATVAAVLKPLVVEHQRSAHELTELKQREHRRQRRERLRGQLADAGLAETATEKFFELLCDADERTATRLIEERADWMRQQRKHASEVGLRATSCQSKEQRLVAGDEALPRDFLKFAELITG